MTQGRQKCLHLGFLFLFLLFTLFIDLFHTEKSFKEDKNCPACNFHKLSDATSQIHFFYVPPLTLSFLLRLIPSFKYVYLFSNYFSSRSPPHF
jgi:hypothetical protein